jgi:transcriptional regulator
MEEGEISWRRSKVLDLSSHGYSQHEIATKLQIPMGTVNSDLTHLRRQAQENLQKHIHEVVPEEYQKCMVGMKRNLKETLEITNSVTDPRVKLQPELLQMIATNSY